MTAIIQFKRFTSNNRSKEHLIFKCRHHLMILKACIMMGQTELFETLNQLMIHCFKALQLDLIYCEEFDSDWDFEASSQIIWFRNFAHSWFRSELQSEFVNLLIQIGTSEHKARIIWFSSGLQCGFVNLLIKNWTSMWVHKSFFFFTVLL